MLARMSVATSWSLLWEGVQGSALATCNLCDKFMSLAVEEGVSFHYPWVICVQHTTKQKCRQLCEVTRIRLTITKICSLGMDEVTCMPGCPVICVHY